MREGGHRPEAFAKGRRDEGVVVDIMIVAMLREETNEERFWGAVKKGSPLPPTKRPNYNADKN